MANVIDVTDSNFEQEVLGSDLPVLVDCWAEWCMPCKAIAPLVHKLADEHDGKLKVVQLDVQVHMNTAMTHRITSIPTLLVFKGGKEVARKVGAGGGMRALQNLVSPYI